MVTPAAGMVVLVPFPFSDLSQAKLRPAVVLADVGGGNWILCQITSNPYGDARSLMLEDASFALVMPDKAVGLPAGIDSGTEMRY